MGTDDAQLEDKMYLKRVFIGLVGLAPLGWVVWTKRNAPLLASETVTVTETVYHGLIPAMGELLPVYVIALLVLAIGHGAKGGFLGRV